MTLDFINPPELGTPRGFSHATAATGTRRVYLAGQTALDATGKIIAGGIVEQFEQALSNLLTALAAAGGSPADLASMTIYIVDMEAYQRHAHEIGQVWKTLIGPHYPALAGIGVARLWDAEALVEVQGIAEITPVA
jgi:enamine deaminase RidA (YjgF/YER057c/UK114 family)